VKVSVLQENLNQGLTTALRFISTRPQLPVLANCLLAVDKGRLKISATNLEAGISLWLGAKIEKEGQTTVLAKTLAEYVACLPADRVDLEIIESNLRVASVSTLATFPTIAAAEFPKIAAFPAKADLQLSLAAFSQAVSEVAFSAGQDEGRPVLTGVLLKKEEKGFSLVGTDGYRLSVKNFSLDSGLPGDLIIPARVLSEAVRLKGEKSEEKEGGILGVAVTQEENQVIFALPEIELSCRLIEGSFPDYEKIIPKEETTKIIFDREEFLRAVRLASIFARESANIVKLKIEEQKLKISANSPQVGENESTVAIKQEGEDQEIAFNFRFLLDFLNNTISQEVSLGMTGPLNPGVFRLVGDNSLLHLVMPVRLQS